MNKTSQTGALILMLCLLIPCFGGAVLGFMNKGQKPVETNENPEHLPYYDNKLWFYTLAGQLIGKYECTTPNCKIASSTSNDSDYPHISDDVLTKELPIINGNLVFLQDESNQVFLYDINKNFAYKDSAYASVKKYNSLENIYIVENANKQFGILKIGEFPQLVVPFENSYIGLLPNESKNIVALQNGKWVLLDASLNKVGNPYDQMIIGASNDYIALKDNNNNAYVVNKDGVKILPDDYQDVILIGNYAGVRSVDNEFMVYNLTSTTTIGDTLELGSDDKVSMKKENNELVIEINGQKQSSIKIS